MDFGSIRYGAQIVQAAATHHIDPQLLAAVAAQETGGPGARSGSNIVGDHGHGHGVFQIDDRSWGFARSPAAMDPGKNANFAAGILSDNLQRYGGNVKMALSAYNTGSPTAKGTTTTWAGGQTLGYADSVLAHYGELGNSASTAAELASETGENLTNVNALLNAYGSGAYGSSASPYPTSPYAATDPSVSPTDPSAASPYTPLRTYSQLSSPSQQLATTADTTMANMIDEGDVFADGGDGDGDP